MCAWARMTAEGKPVREGEEVRQLLAELAERFARDHGDRERDIDAARASPHRNGQSRIRRLVDFFRHTGGFAAEQKNVAGGEGKVGIGGRGFGGEQHDPSLRLRLESAPARMPGHVGGSGIIHPRPLQRLVAPGKAAGLDNVHGRAQARAKAQDRADIPGLIGLIEGEAHNVVIARSAATKQSRM